MEAEKHDELAIVLVRGLDDGMAECFDEAIPQKIPDNNDVFRLLVGRPSHLTAFPIHFRARDLNDAGESFDGSWGQVDGGAAWPSAKQHFHAADT